MPTDNEYSKPFLMNFVALIHDQRLNATHREVFSKVYSLTRNEDEVCYASDAYLAHELHLSSSTIQKCLKKLKDLQYIYVQHEKSESGYGAPKRKIYINELKLIYISNE